jgi:hypothetical protein
MYNSCLPSEALRNVINAREDAMDAGGVGDESADLRTVKSCGPDAPALPSSWRPGADEPQSVDDGDNKPITGEQLC